MGRRGGCGVRSLLGGGARGLGMGWDEAFGRGVGGGWGGGMEGGERRIDLVHWHGLW